MKKHTPPPDPGLAEIDAFERKLVLGKRELWAFNGVGAEEIALFLPAVAAQAKAICDQLREEYLSRRSGA